MAKNTNEIYKIQTDIIDIQYSRVLCPTQQTISYFRDDFMGQMTQLTVS